VAVHRRVVGGFGSLARAGAPASGLGTMGARMTQGEHRQSDAPPSSAEPLSAAGVSELLRSRRYRVLLVGCAVLGVVVAVACWGFLELVHAIQEGVYVHLWSGLGFSSEPSWWPLPPLAVAGVAIAVAVVKLPGRGGHEPTQGLAPGSATAPVDLPGVLLAAVATVGLGLVLGPEAPLLALGSGIALLLAGLPRRKMPDQARQVLVAAAAFAALATIFGSPVIGTVIIIEAAGLGGATLPVVLLPGLIAAGFGVLVFIGVGSLTGLSTKAFALPPLSLPNYPTPRVSDFLWTIALAIVAAIVTFVVITFAKQVRLLVGWRPMLMYPAAALLVAGVAIVFAEITGQSTNAVLFSGQEAMNSVLKQASTLSLGTLALLLVFKSVAWGLSLAAARGGPTFPAIFLGLVGGLLAQHLPGFAETPAIGVLVGAVVVCVLRLPLSSIVLALVLTGDSAGAAPLIIVGVAVAYLATVALTGRTRRNKPDSEEHHDEVGDAAQPASPA
jgi:H+/Cl- antiporter ClcA